MDLKTYFKIIEGKTAELFSAACETGAMIATSNLNQIKSFKSYGKSIGIQFTFYGNSIEIPLNFYWNSIEILQRFY